jgi:hypothetical protein
MPPLTPLLSSLPSAFDTGTSLLPWTRQSASCGAPASMDSCRLHAPLAIRQPPSPGYLAGPSEEGEPFGSHSDDPSTPWQKLARPKEAIDLTLDDDGVDSDVSWPKKRLIKTTFRPKKVIDLTTDEDCDGHGGHDGTTKVRLLGGKLQRL